MAHEQTDELNTYLANLNVMSANVRNMHWNAVGPYFAALHCATEKVYKELQKQIDEVAELMKIHKMQPLTKMSDYLNATTLEELKDKEFNEHEIIDNIVADGSELMKQAREIRDNADDEDDFMIVNKFEEYLCCYAKMEWMVRAMHVDENPIDDDEDD